MPNRERGFAVPQPDAAGIQRVRTCVPWVSLKHGAKTHMQGNSSPRLTLSVWKDFVPPRILALPDEEGGRFLDSKSDLQEEIYSWRPHEDVFAGISDNNIRLALHRQLIERLDVSKSPGERRMTALEDFVTAAEDAIVSGAVASVPSESESDDDFTGDKQIRIDINPLLALTLHLRWLLSCFGNRPGISVSVR